MTGCILIGQASVLASIGLGAAAAIAYSRWSSRD